ncbi:MAG: hypothetical protein ABEJ61_09780 [Haloferacaceae archaeon]
MDDHDHGSETAEGRVTSPMQSFGASEVGIGVLVCLVGLAVTFALPLALA